MNMADVIASRRKEKGLTQKQLADKLGVTDKAVSKWERGGGYPDIGYLEPLAEALDITVSELLKGKTEEVDPESGGEEDNDATIIKKMLDYANSVYETRNKNMPRIAMLPLWAAGLVGIITTTIVDFALNGRFTWSLFPISSIVFVWMCISPLSLFGRRGIDIAFLFTGIFVFPFLYIIERLTGGGWFARVALPIAIAGAITLWSIRVVFKTKLSVWNKLAVSSLLGAAANVAIAFIVGGIFDDGGFGVWNLISIAILGVMAIILFVIGSTEKNR